MTQRYVTGTPDERFDAYLHPLPHPPNRIHRSLQALPRTRHQRRNHRHRHLARSPPTRSRLDDGRPRTPHRHPRIQRLGQLRNRHPMTRDPDTSLAVTATIVALLTAAAAVLALLEYR